ncbi:4-coumarate-ligase protein [Diplodia corticola]|uniref:4-coumarate-ligase protein n=1 Tax=Diplodia corticola TaxID=236234 RepID=A0A1J9S4G9_9PEZI|nr:4-coumarate-ligase protein [Diplodia corticola]OJD39851.1 4-coumarate-ligase protein [Diplodia corticola]
MAGHIEAPKFELLRANWEARQQTDPTNRPLSPTTPGRTPAQQRLFYTSSSETRESKARRFSSFATFTSPINPFTRRDRAAMPFPKSPSYKALVAPEKREEPPPALKRGPGSRLPSFKGSSNAMPPPALPTTKSNGQAASDRWMMGRLSRSQTTSNIPLLASKAAEPMKQPPVKHLPAGVPPLKATGPRQPSQSASNLIRSRPPTPHRSADEPMPVTAHSTNNLISLTSSASSTNVRSKLPTPALNRDTRQSGMATKMFGGMKKTPKIREKRSYTQPNLTSVTNMSSQIVTPRKTVFREEFATKTPRYMASENRKPLPCSDDLFGPVGSVKVTEISNDEDLGRYGPISAEDWTGMLSIESPTSNKPVRVSNNSQHRRPSQHRLHSAGSLPQNNLLTPLSPPFPRTPRHSTAHSQSLFPPSGGTNPPTILRHSHLSPCPEDSNPKTAIRFISTGQLRSWSPPQSPTPTRSSSSSSSSAPPPSPTPTSGKGSVRDVNNPPSYALVNKAQPSAYWAGRFASGFDRLRLEAFHAEGHAFRTSGRVSDTFGAFVDGSEEVRARRVFAELAACCRSDEATRSLRDFQAAWARKSGSVACMPPPAVIVLNAGVENRVGNGNGNNNNNNVAGGGEEGLRGGEGKGRKTGMGFMEKLKGMARKSSA